MELAPVMGLSDRIVDIVETGSTLKANGLEPKEWIEDISARLIVNKASFKTKHAALSEIIDGVEQAVRTASGKGHEMAIPGRCRFRPAVASGVAN